ncbi:nuclear transport factor 2 family protein [Phenylobacterium terrae]|uniref:Nuclear transport factor 2 family protein n=1 Tax=Phenylobacterium terrae TaxID=2665495 RepID=A0ABW4N4W5_9CAUL
MHLNPSIQAYFEADRRGDVEALIQTFAPHAAVSDEGRSYVGRQAIGAWWREAKAKYQHVIEPVRAGGEGDLAEVRARVTGQFPGSPTIMTFAFRLEGGQIAGLEIGA